MYIMEYLEFAKEMYSTMNVNMFKDFINGLVTEETFIQKANTNIYNKHSYVYFSRDKQNVRIITTCFCSDKVMKQNKFKKLVGDVIEIPFVGGDLVFEPSLYGVSDNKFYFDVSTAIYKEYLINEINTENSIQLNEKLFFDLYDKYYIFYKVSIKYKQLYNDNDILCLFGINGYKIDTKTKKNIKNKNKKIIEDTDSVDTAYTDFIGNSETDSLQNSYSDSVDTTDTIESKYLTKTEKIHYSLKDKIKFYIPLENHIKSILITTLYDCYNTNDKFKKLVLDNDKIIITKSLHYDNSVLKYGFHFNIKFSKNNIYSDTYHCYVENGKIYKITAIVNLL